MSTVERAIPLLLLIGLPLAAAVVIVAIARVSHSRAAANPTDAEGPDALGDLSAWIALGGLGLPLVVAVWTRRLAGAPGPLRFVDGLGARVGDERAWLGLDAKTDVLGLHLWMVIAAVALLRALMLVSEPAGPRRARLQACLCAAVGAAGALTMLQSLGMQVLAFVLLGITVRATRGDWGPAALGLRAMARDRAADVAFIAAIVAVTAVLPSLDAQTLERAAAAGERAVLRTPLGGWPRAEWMVALVVTAFTLRRVDGGGAGRSRGAVTRATEAVLDGIVTLAAMAWLVGAEGVVALAPHTLVGVAVLGSLLALRGALVLSAARDLDRWCAGSGDIVFGGALACLGMGMFASAVAIAMIGGLGRAVTVVGLERAAFDAAPRAPIDQSASPSLASLCRGLGGRGPWLAGGLTVSLLALAGPVPATAGWVWGRAVVDVAAAESLGSMPTNVLGVIALAVGVIALARSGGALVAMMWVKRPVDAHANASVVAVDPGAIAGSSRDSDRAEGHGIVVAAGLGVLAWASVVVGWTWGDSLLEREVAATLRVAPQLDGTLRVGHSEAWIRDDPTGATALVVGWVLMSAAAVAAAIGGARGSPQARFGWAQAGVAALAGVRTWVVEIVEGAFSGAIEVIDRSALPVVGTAVLDFGGQLGDRLRRIGTGVRSALVGVCVALLVVLGWLYFKPTTATLRPAAPYGIGGIDPTLAPVSGRARGKGGARDAGGDEPRDEAERGPAGAGEAIDRAAGTADRRRVTPVADPTAEAR